MVTMTKQTNETTTAPTPQETPRAESGNALGDTDINFGDAIKMLDGGKIGGYLIRWGSEEEHDASAGRDYFTPATNFGKAIKSGVDVTFNHGIPLRRVAWASEEIIGATVKATTDKYGLFVEAILEASDEYKKVIEDMINAGRLKWSSGAVSHLVKRARKSRGANEIKQWIIGEAALTPSPAEPRLPAVMNMKAYTAYCNTETAEADKESRKTGDVKQDAVNAIKPKSKTENINMDELESKVQEAVKAALAQKESELKAAQTLAAENETAKAKSESRIAELEKSVEKIMNAPANKSGGFAEVKSTEKPFKTMGAQLKAIKNFATNPGGAAEDYNRLMAVKATGASEGVASDGGFLLQNEFVNETLDRVYSMGSIMSLVNKRAIGAGANGLTINTINETSRADGSRFGGVRAYWLNEAGTKTKSKPTYRRFVLPLEKVIGLYYATDELLQDETALGGEVGDMFAKEINFVCEDAIVNGTGAGMPLGVLTSGSTVSVSKETGQAAATIVYQNLVKMWARMWAPSRTNAVWLISQDAEPQLDQLSLAAGTGALEPRFVTYGEDGMMKMKGRPVMPVEYTAALGTVGDVILFDPSGYRWIDRGGVESASSIHVQFTTDESTFRWVYRANGAPFWASALTPKNGGSTLGQCITLATRA